MTLQAQAFLGLALGAVLALLLHLAVRKRYLWWWQNPAAAGSVMSASTLITLVGPRLLVSMLGSGGQEDSTSVWSQALDAVPYAIGAGIGLALCVWFFRLIVLHPHRGPNIADSMEDGTSISGERLPTWLRRSARR